jgi:hypothetical protein
MGAKWHIAETKNKTSLSLPPSRQHLACLILPDCDEVDIN